MIIKRYLSNAHLAHLATSPSPFQFLLDLVKSYELGIDLCIRDDYLNLYHRGNSLAKIEFSSSNHYRITMHEQFLGKKMHGWLKSQGIPRPAQGSILSTKINMDQLHPFLQKNHLKELCQRIKAVAFSEELAFEQLLMADNRCRKDLIFIDRQVCDRQWRRRADLLALRQIEKDRYKLVVFEIKLGQNSDMSGAVIQQLADYVSHIGKNKLDYQKCYQRHFSQKKQLGLLDWIPYDQITIVDKVDGAIVVAGHAGVTQQAISKLKNNRYDFKVYGPLFQLQL